MKNIIGLLILVLVLLIFSNNLFSQEKTDTDKPENAFNIYFINGYAISYNFYQTKNYYLRAQLDLSTKGEEIDADGETDYSNVSYDKNTVTTNSESNYFLIGISTYFIYPVYNTPYGNIYLGAGPAFNYSNNSNTLTETRKEFAPDSTTVQYSATYVTTNNEKNYDLSAVFIVGIEAYITENISIVVEANVKGGNRWQNNSYEHSYSNPSGDYSKYTSSTDGYGWFYEAQFIRLGVSISL